MHSFCQSAPCSLLQRQEPSAPSVTEQEEREARARAATAATTYPVHATIFPPKPAPPAGWGGAAEEAPAKKKVCAAAWVARLAAGQLCQPAGRLTATEVKCWRAPKLGPTQVPKQLDARWVAERELQPRLEDLWSPPQQVAGYAPVPPPALQASPRHVAAQLLGLWGLD